VSDFMLGFLSLAPTYRQAELSRSPSFGFCFAQIAPLIGSDQMQERVILGEHIYCKLAES